jgi:hypothetical protein
MQQPVARRAHPSTRSLRGARTAAGGPGNEAISPRPGETASSASGRLAATAAAAVRVAGRQARTVVETAGAAAPTAGPRQPRLLDRLLDALRDRDCSLATEQAYVSWAERFVHFHHRRHPSDLGEADIARFLRHLARDLGAPASAQSQAFAALLFFYREVLRRDLEWRRVITRTSRPWQHRTRSSACTARGSGSIAAPALVCHESAGYK